MTLIAAHVRLLYKAIKVTSVQLFETCAVIKSNLGIEKTRTHENILVKEIIDNLQIGIKK